MLLQNFEKLIIFGARGNTANYFLKILEKEKFEGEITVVSRDKSKNNYFNQHYGSLQLNGRIYKNVFFKGLALITKQKRGVPGQIWSPSNASHEDNLYIYASSLNWITKLGEGSLKVFLRNSDDYYNNPKYAMSNKNRLSTSSIYLSNPIARSNNYLLDFSLSLEQQSLESDTDTYKKDVDDFIQRGEFDEYSINQDWIKGIAFGMAYRLCREVFLHKTIAEYQITNRRKEDIKYLENFKDPFSGQLLPSKKIAFSKALYSARLDQCIQDGENTNWNNLPD